MTRAVTRALAALSLSALLAPAAPALTPLARAAQRPVSLAALAAPTALATLAALLSALWVAEVAPRPLARAAGQVYAAAAAVPSVAWASLVGSLLAPRLGGTVAAAALLTAVAVPTTALAALEALDQTPTALRESALALGASPLQVAWRAVVPATRRALLGAALLGAGRAFGESIVLLTLGSSPAPGHGALLALAALALAANRWCAREASA